MKFLLYLIIFVNISMAQNKLDMEKLSWLVDKWVSTNGESTSYEHWTKQDENIFIGGSETIKNGDTVFNEKLRIEKIGDSIFYIADVKHNPAPVYFKMTALKDDEVVFENPEHDFPQKIIYRQIEGNLHASIEGPGSNGNWKKIDFVMNKMR